MIDYALAHKDELSKLLARFNCSPDAIYSQPYIFIDTTEIVENTWHKLQLVAIHAGQIKGFMSASIARETLCIEQVAVCKFCDGHELELAADIARIFKFLQQHFRWLRWSVISGAPTEPVYARICREFGGAIVGRYSESARLRDGRLADTIYFQVRGTERPDGVTMIPEEFRC